MSGHNLNRGTSGEQLPFPGCGFLAALTLVLVLFTTAIVAHAGDSASLLIRLKSGLSAEQQTAVIARNGGVESSVVPALRLHVISIPSADLAAVEAAYRLDAEVENVEPNLTRQVEGISNDSSVGVQWGLEKIGWSTVFGSVAPTGSAKVAILDTGIDASHPDLRDNVLPGVSILDGSTGQTDPNGHGTWMAGIVAAVTNNDEGIAGVAFGGVKLLPVTVLGADGTGRDSDIISGIVWAADHDADVILMAFSNADFSSNLQQAVDYAWAKGAVVVAATGNNGMTSATYPAGNRSVVGVSATSEDDLLAAGSNVGQDVFLAAPGSNLFTTGTGGSYTYVTGTSGAAAVVAGVASFMKAVDPALSNAVIVGRLARSADAVGTAGDPENVLFFGNGRINMTKAVADTGTDEVQPAGAPGGGGPYVGPYTAAADYKLAGIQVDKQTGTLTYGTVGTATFKVTAKIQGNGGPGVVVKLSAATTAQDVTFEWKNAADTAPADWTLHLTGDNTYTLHATTSASTPATVDVAAKVTARDDTTQKSGSDNLVIGKAGQTIGNITFSPATLNSGGTTTASATATSNLAVTFSSLTANVCTVSGSEVSALAAGDCSIAADQAGNGNYSAALRVIGTLTVGKAKQGAVTVTAPAQATFGQKGLFAIASGGSGTGTYSYSTAAPTTACSVDAVSGAITITSGTGTCSITATRSEDSNYLPETSSAVTVTVNKATATVTVLPVTATFDGKPHGSTGTVTGIDSTSLGAATIGYSTASGAAPVNAGSYTATGSFAGDQNYLSASGTASITIEKALPTVTVLPVTATYDGSPHGTTGTVAGVEGGSVEISYTPGGVAPVNAGSYTATGSFAGNENYLPATGNAVITINKGVPTVSVLSVTATYDGQPHGTTGSVTGVNGASLGEAGISYPGGSVPVNAGNYTATGSFAGNDNYASATGTATITINKAAATVSVVPVTTTYDGQPHGTTGNVAGVNGASLGEATIAYPAGSAPVNAGSYTVTGSFAGNENYLAATGTASITINKATPAVSVTAVPRTIYDGQPHGTTGTVTGVAGASLGTATISYDTADHTAPINAGSYTATGSFAGNDNYLPATGSTTIIIDKATPVVTVSTVPRTIYDGAPHGTSGTVAGVGGASLGAADMSYDTPEHTAPINAGSYTATGSFAGNLNYTAASATTTIIIDKATPTVTVIPVAPVTYDGTPHGTTGTVTGVAGASLGSASMSYDTADHKEPVNAGSYTATGSFAGNINYEPAAASTAIVIEKARATVSVATAGLFTYDGTPHGTTGTIYGVGGVSLGAAAMSYDTADHSAPVNAGSYLATGSFDGNMNYLAAKGTMTITINKAPTSVVLIASANPAVLGQPVTVTATVSSSGGVPAGMVTFSADGAVLGTVKLNDGGKAELPLSNLAVGIHPVSVSYSESANFLGANAALSEAVNYGVGGLQAPYAPPTQKAFKIKSAIPIKWQFRDFSGAVVNSASASPAIAIRGPYRCNESPDSVTTYALLDDAGNSGYQYDSVSNTWQYNWKTAMLGAGCYAIEVSTGRTGNSSQSSTAYVEYPIMLK